jgi:hypothetical protein
MAALTTIASARRPFSASFLSATYNVGFKGGALQSRMPVHGFEGLRPEQFDWVWMVDEMRRATPDEIRNLCKAPTKGR